MNSFNDDKCYQILAHNFSRVSVGIKFVTIGQSGEAGQRSKEMEANGMKHPLYFQTQLRLRPLNRFPSFYANMHVLV